MKPKPVVVQTPDNHTAVASHFQGLRASYGSVVIISLLDQSGIAADLAEAYETYVRLLAAPAVSFVGFALHALWKGGKYENIALLVQQVKADLAEHGYFSQTAGSNGVQTRQAGVMRVNCLDCLDRTNVVQSVFAHVILRNQLECLGLLDGGDPIENHAAFESAFKNSTPAFSRTLSVAFELRSAWADNADSISREYTGTGALKTTFTRSVRSYRFRGP